MSTLSQNFVDATHERAAAITSFVGQPPALAAQTANGMMYQTYIEQASMLAYVDVFAMLTILCAVCVPFMFFFSPGKAAGGGGH
jgi:DHA2 family multidrug resistance protein